MTLLTLLKATTGGGGMPITVTARHNTNAGQTSGQTRATNSTGPTADSLFLCFFGAENDNHTQVPSPQTPVGGGWTYTQRATSGVSTAYEWDGTTGFRLSQALYTAPIGDPLLNYTITVDMYSTTNLGYYSAICLDVTGHDTGGTPLYYTNGANISTASDSASGTVTLGAAPAVGSLVVVSFYSGADSGGTMSAATVGGQSMTAVTVQTTSGFSLQGVWSREWTGVESDNTITCPDLGQQVGSYTAIAVVIPAAAGGGGTTGTIAVTQASDTSAASGQLGYSGTVAATQAAQTSTASGTVTVPVTGTIAANQAANTAAATGKLGYSGTLAETQANQTATAAGQLGSTGTVAATQANQTASASGVVTAGGSFAGTIAVTQANQTAAATGKLGYSGTAAPTQASNTVTATGTVINPVTGTVAATQANQTASAAGILRYTGTVTVSQGSNIASIQGIFFIPITGTVAVAQANQTVTASGSALGDIVERPFTGSTSHPSSGTTPRPFAGVTERP